MNDLEDLLKTYEASSSLSCRDEEALVAYLVSLMTRFPKARWAFVSAWHKVGNESK